MTVAEGSNLHHYETWWRMQSEAEADADYAAGRFTRHLTTDEFFKGLDDDE